MRKLTTEEFIKKAKAVHGGRYNYDKSVYTISSEKLIITCPAHGDFLQKANGHLNGFGCRKCSDKIVSLKNKKTTQCFVKQARSIHGNKYQYHNTVYDGDKNKLTITCKEHGNFRQRAGSHLKGKGCPVCGGSVRGDKNKFIEKSRSIHGDRYVYDFSEYENCKVKTEVICKDHGSFFVSPSNHLKGRGCPICKREMARNRKKSNTNDFIRKSIVIHGDVYDYSGVEYVSSKTDVVILCHAHGAFSQKPNNHLLGNGCPSCAKYGFDKLSGAFVYFMMSGAFVKVGITKDVKRREKKLRMATPFDFQLIKTIKTTGVEAIVIEKYYHTKYESAGMAGFDGATEWLKYSTELMDEIMG